VAIRHVFRRAFYKFLPGWLSSGDGEKVFASLGAVKDMYLERVRQGFEQRFPSRAGTSALRLIGEDRGIPRGRSETAEHYAARLRAWRFPRGHRVRGSAYALLEQVSEYWGGMFCQTIDNNGTLHQRSETGAESFSYGNTWNWDGAASTNWARFWLILRPIPDVAISAWPSWSTAWGGTTWGAATAAGYTWGQQGVTAADAAAMRRLVTPPTVPTGGPAWKPAGTRAMYIIVVLEDHGAESPTAITPAGAWGTVAGRATAPSVLRFWRFA
jgi:hypothetical protein